MKKLWIKVSSQYTLPLDSKVLLDTSRIESFHDKGNTIWIRTYSHTNYIYKGTLDEFTKLVEFKGVE